MVGSGHSPTDIPLTAGYMVEMRAFNHVLSVDRATHRVTAQAGILLSELNTALEGYGLALSSLGSISEQTLSGAISTATHGINPQAHRRGIAGESLILVLSSA